MFLLNLSVLLKISFQDLSQIILILNFSQPRIDPVNLLNLVNLFDFFKCVQEITVISWKCLGP